MAARPLRCKPPRESLHRSLPPACLPRKFNVESFDSFPPTMRARRSGNREQQRPASAENFMSEHEVISMLGSLHEQKVQAEQKAVAMQEQIVELRQSLSSLQDSEEQDGAWASRAESVSEGRSDDTASEPENLVRLRSYILDMQEGASLLLWKEDGLQVCWFWLDKDGLSLHWDVDEEADSGNDGAGGSLLLERIVDIVPLGACADQLSDSPTDSSFSVQLQDHRLDIVAPTSLDFQVWYFGLAFATRLRLSALEEASACSDTQTAERTGAEEQTSSEAEHGKRNVAAAQTGDDGSEALAEDDQGSGVRRRRAAEAQRPEEIVETQRRVIHKLQQDNQMLHEARRIKDQAIERLLHDLQVALCVYVCVCARAREKRGTPACRYT